MNQKIIKKKTDIELKAIYYLLKLEEIALLEKATNLGYSHMNIHNVISINFVYYFCIVA